MEITPIGMVFRSIAIIIAIIIAFFSYKIYLVTKGVKGWFYLVLSGLSLFLWAITAQIFSFIDMSYTRYVTGIITLCLMAFFVPVAYTRLVIDFKISKPKWLNTFFSGSLVIGIFLIILIINIIRLDQLSQQTFLRVLLSVSHLTLGLSLTYAIIPTYYLMKSTRRSPWILAFLFCILVAFGINLGQYYSTCCWEGSSLSHEPVCSQYKMDYVPVYGTECNNGILSIGGFYQIFLITGIILGAVSFYQLWKKMSF
jgi:hypothetical protein